MFSWIRASFDVIDDVVMSAKALTGQMRYRVEDWAAKDKEYLDNLAKEEETPPATNQEEEA